MHPPVDEAVLKNNPQFAGLYKTLTTAILNTNCSTKNDPAHKEREAMREVPLTSCIPLHPDTDPNIL